MATHLLSTENGVWCVAIEETILFSVAEMADDSTTPARSCMTEVGSFEVCGKSSLRNHISQDYSSILHA